jgi:hypothetical protein
MKTEGRGSVGCVVIDDFVGQGTPTDGQSLGPEAPGTAGCAIITEFIGQGQATLVGQMGQTASASERGPLMPKT